mgnify:CR=1 FL=1
MNKEKIKKELANGAQIMSFIEEQIVSPDTIEDVVIGYLLIQDQNTRLFVLEPNWFVISGNSWSRITPPSEGSVNIGLE